MGFGDKLREKATEAVDVMAFNAAAAERQAGATVYTPTLKAPGDFARATAVNVYGLRVAAIERAGWQLEHWTATETAAHPLFRLRT